MNFGEIIDRSRTRFRDTLIAAIRQSRDDGLDVIAEPTPRDRSGAIIPAPDGLMLPLRYDFVVRADGGNYQPRTADTVTLCFSEPVFATWEDTLRIELRSLAWDYIRIQCVEGAPITDFEPVRRWFLKWFDSEDESSADEDGLLGVVHFISDPVSAGASTTFFVDLGSASSDSLADLFDVLVSVGVTRCILGDTEVAT